MLNVERMSTCSNFHSMVRKITGKILSIKALDCLLRDCPDLKPHLEDERGNLPPFINVFLNEEDIRFLDGKASQCQQGDEISIVAAIAGG